jgi:hypothetical protein
MTLSQWQIFKVAELTFSQLADILSFIPQQSDLSYILSRPPSVEFFQDKEQTQLRYKGDVVRISNTYFTKLVRNNKHISRVRIK